MALTELDLPKIEDAIKTGTLEIHKGDRFYRYQSMDDLIKVYNFIKRESNKVKAKNGGVNPLYSVADFR